MVEYGCGRRVALSQERFDTEIKNKEFDQGQGDPTEDANAASRVVSVQMSAKIKVADYCGAPGTCTASVSLWDSNPDVYAQIFEGRRIKALTARRTLILIPLC